MYIKNLKSVFGGRQRPSENRFLMVSHSKQQWETCRESGFFGWVGPGSTEGANHKKIAKKYHKSEKQIY